MLQFHDTGATTVTPLCDGSAPRCNRGLHLHPCGEGVTEQFSLWTKGQRFSSINVPHRGWVKLELLVNFLCVLYPVQFQSMDPQGFLHLVFQTSLMTLSLNKVSQTCCICRKQITPDFPRVPGYSQVNVCEQSCVSDALSSLLYVCSTGRCVLQTSWELSLLGRKHDMPVFSRKTWLESDIMTAHYGWRSEI